MSVEKCYPLTYPQKAIWNTEKTYPGTSIRNIAATLRIKGNVDYEILERAINLFMEKNEAARIRIIEIDGQPQQYVSEYKYQKLDFYDFTDKDITELYKWDSELAMIPLSMIGSELIYFDLIKVSEDDGGFFVRVDHLISDAWTMSLIGNQVLDYYFAIKNEGEVSAENSPSYIDYIKSEEDYLSSDRFLKDKAYWDKEFDTYPEKTVLKKCNPKDISTKARRKTIQTPKKLTEKIYQYCSEHKTSPFVLFLAALSMYINRVTSEGDINLGTTTLNRSNKLEKNIVGMFSNIVPLRIKINSHMDFNTFVKLVTTETISMLKHQRYPYDLVLKEVRKKHKKADSIFDIVIIYQNAKLAKGKYNEQFIGRWHFSGFQAEALNISINDRENEGQLIVDYSYLVDLFKAKEIEFLNQHIINILWHALDNPAKEISKLNMLSETERFKVLYKFNDFDSKDNKETMIYDISGNLVGKVPERTKLYILDKELNPVPISIAGELYQSDNCPIQGIMDGDGINQESTANPFMPGERIFKTGYRARWYPNGDIVILGKTGPKQEKNASVKEKLQVNIASTFTAEPVSDYIRWWGTQFGYDIAISFAGYNQVFQELIDQQSIFYKNKDGINILFVRFEDFLRSDNETDEKRLLKLDQISEELIQAIMSFNNTSPLVLPIFPVSDHLGLSSAIKNKIDQLYLQINQIFSDYKHVYISDLKETGNIYGINDVFDSVKDKEGHMPFTEEYYAALGTQVVRKIHAIKNQQFKVIVLDCDNTLWDGVCGEQGATKVEINGAFKVLQEFMLQKHNEGMILAICSKNNMKDVIQVFKNNPGMILTDDNITSWKVNWQEKSQSIREIAEELNLGLDSFIFIDDNPLECSKMAENCPEVLTLPLPPEKENIPLFLKHVWAFDRVKVTHEDMLRTKMYQAEQKRKEVQGKGISLDEYIKNLQLRVSMREIQEDEVVRAAQLTQRTNQFNLSTTRRTEEEIHEIIRDKETTCFVIDASDKFGDYGIIGLIILKSKNDSVLLIDTFLLSCRILGRKVEHTLLSGIRRYAEETCKSEVEALYKFTAKNKPIKEFIGQMNWKISDKGEKWIKYILGVNDLPQEIEHIAFHYNATYKTIINGGKGHKEKTSYNKYSKKSILAEDNESIKTTLTDDPLCQIETVKNIKHKEYLLPLINCTGNRLLELPVFEGANREIAASLDLYHAPTTQTETKLAVIWETVLRTEKIGIDNNYFDLGGDSLNAINIIAKIHKEFNVGLTLLDIFEASTIRKLAEKIDGTSRSEYEQIVPVETLDYYELSSAQKRMFILHQIEKDPTGYNECQKILIEGSLDKKKLERAFNDFIKRHEALRTGFEMVNGEPVQKIYDKVDFQISNQKATEHEIEEITQSFIKTFDLSAPPLMRVKLLELHSEKHVLLFDIHHIIIDGTSFGILIKEIMALYKGRQLEPLKVHYKDFANWQNQLFKSKKIKKQEKYWIEQYKGEIPVLNMPTDQTRPPMQSFNGRKDYFTLEKNVVTKLRNICDNTETTMFMMLFSAFNILLYKYTGQEDIVVGTPVAGRTHADIKETVGVFVNTLPIRTYPIAEIKFIEYVKEVRETILLCLENQDYQYERLVEKLSVTRDASRNPLFDVIFAMQNMELPEIKLDGLKFTQCKMDNRKSKLDMSLFTTEKHDGIEFEFEYCSDLYEEATIKRFGEHFLNLLNDISDNPNKQISEIEIMSQDEKHKILYEFNDTQVDYPKEKTIHQLFEEQVEKTPDNVAVVFKAKQLTYRELNEKSNQLAKVLRVKGIKPDSIVGIMVERSLEMIIGILAILKAGGAYLPIDPEYPVARIKYMLEDSNASVLLTEKSLISKVEFYGEIIDIIDDEIYKGESENLTNINKSSDLIYVIYTSGSTGKPKGVMLEHKNVINFIQGVVNKIGFSKEDIVLCLTTISFDIFVLETWLPMTRGIRIVLADREQQLDIGALIEVTLKNGVTSVQMTPSRMRAILEDSRFDQILYSLKNIMLGGEPLTQSVLEGVKSKTKAKIFNMYGPTETSIWSSIDDLTIDNKITLGKPIANTQFYVLDKNLKIQPTNVPGELCIAGSGVARGYWNRSELTSERFIQNPFVPEGKMYKTGDLVKRLPDGCVEFIGRMDDQIKIRGFRIELSEIRSNILEYEDIKDAIVITSKLSDSNNILYSYFISDKKTDVNQLREFLANKLPDYMVPPFIIQIDSFPTTPNGKLDKKALLEKENFSENQDNDTPINDIEEIILNCWRRRLNNNHISVNDNFFMFGGDSLSIISIISELLSYEWDLKMQHFYDFPTVRKLANNIMNADIIENEGYEEIIPVLSNKYKPIDNSKNILFKNVLLTGATGFLGIHILTELMEQSKANVYCLLRGDYSQSKNKLFNLLHFYFGSDYDKYINDRILCVNGDISVEKFGLRDKDYYQLGEKTDLVIHAAANVKHQGDYSEFEKANVLGTKEVICFCKRFNIKLGYMSTESVSGDYVVRQEYPKPRFTENDLFIGQKYNDNVYVKSKFLAESSVIEAMQTDIDAIIFRLGYITGRFSDGQFQKNINDNNFYNIIRSIIEVGVVPNEILQENIEFSPVDYCAKGIIKLVVKNDAYGNVLHFYNHNYIKIDNLISIINKILNIDIAIVANLHFDDYLKLINHYKSDKNAISIIANNFNYEKIILDDYYRVNILNNITQSYIKQVGFEWPEIDEIYIKKILNYIFDNVDLYSDGFCC